VAPPSGAGLSTVIDLPDTLVDTITLQLPNFGGLPT
jgi:hypothetical protein